MRLSEQLNIFLRSFYARFLSFNAQCIFNFFFRETGIKEKIFFINFRMADLEAVLADVSYLMAMEKSKSSTSSTKNGRRLTLPDRDSAHVIRRYLTERDLLQFHKVFNERLGFELFAAFCKRKKFNQKAHFHVPMLFYRQIEGTLLFFAFKIIFKHLNLQISSLRIATILPEKYTILL